MSTESEEGQLECILKYARMSCATEESSAPLTLAKIKNMLRAAARGGSAQPSTVLRHLHKLTAKGPLRALLTYGLALQAANLHSLAIHHFEPVLETTPAFMAFLLLLADSELALGHTGRAQEHLQILAREGMPDDQQEAVRRLKQLSEPGP
jgi:hypothetical protein